MNRQYPLRAILGCAVAGLMLAAPVTAQNLVQNAGFDTGLDPWVPFAAFGLTEVWSPVDAANDPNSGSIYGTLPADGTFRVPIYATQCVAVAPNTLYMFGGKILLPSASTPATAYATVFVNTYPNSGCFGNSDANTVAPNVTTLDAWTETFEFATTGPDDQSFQVNLRVYAPAGTTLQSYFDDVFVLAVSDVLFRDGFE